MGDEATGLGVLGLKTFLRLRRDVRIWRVIAWLELGVITLLGLWLSFGKRH